MPVRRDISYSEGLFFITFTCHKWLPLIAQTNSYGLFYNWFDYLNKQNHRIGGYVIMPNHVHVLIDFVTSAKKINTIIGDGKRFMAYDIISRLEKAGNVNLLQQLEKAVSAKDKNNGKKHEVWKESFDRKYCETAKFAYQKLIYMHNNPCAGKWKLVEDITRYDHSSARYYITGKHAAYKVVDVEEIIRENTLKREASVLRSCPESLLSTWPGVGDSGREEVNLQNQGRLHSHSLETKCKR